MKTIRKLAAALLSAVLFISAVSLPTLAAGDMEDTATAEQVIREYAEAHSGLYSRLGIGYYNTETGEEAYYCPDEYFEVASLYKVGLCMYWEAKVTAGEMDWKDPVEGFELGYLVHESIIYSNNNCAGCLAEGVGGIWQYREAIADYYGVDMATVDERYFKAKLGLSNTSRQIIQCLRYLYENAEDFPYVLELMQEAEPERYFRFGERRFPMAHKYGYLKTDAYYLHDSAIVYTDTPFCLVVFSANAQEHEQLLSDVCTLMCDYTQMDTQRRLAAGWTAPTPEPSAEPTPEPTAEPTAAPTDEPAPTVSPAPTLVPAASTEAPVTTEKVWQEEENRQLAESTAKMGRKAFLRYGLPLCIAAIVCAVILLVRKWQDRIEPPDE